MCKGPQNKGSKGKEIVHRCNEWLKEDIGTGEINELGNKRTV